MRLALADSLEVGRGLSHSYDWVYVLNETFNDFENLRSMPAALDGFDTKSRDAFLDWLGHNVDLAWVDEKFQSAVGGIGADFSDLVAAFEMNLYAKYPEIWDFAKVSWLLSQFGDRPEFYLDSYLSGSPQIESFLRKALQEGAFRVRKSWLIRSWSRIRVPGEVMISAAKGQAWLFVLAARSLASPRFQSLQGVGENLVICPVTPNVGNSDGKFGPYWRFLESVGEHFAAQPRPVFFSQGLFFGASGRVQRLQSIVGIFRSVLRVEAALVKTLLQLLKLLGTHSKSDVGQQKALGPLWSAFLRSAFGPSFVQGFWENLQFSFFFNQVKPKSVFFLCENQSWEKALVNQGRRQSPGTHFFGVVHNAVRPWDLRYFQPHTWDSGPMSGRQSAPDQLLVTSEFCFGRLRSYYPSIGRIRLVETLRFRSPEEHDPGSKSETVVIAASYSPLANVQLMRFVSQSVTDESLARKLRVRSHPLQAVKSPYPRFESKTEFPLFTICDSTSTFPVELAEMHAPHFVARFGHLPNMSPLADVPHFWNVFLLPGVQIEHLIDASRRTSMVKPDFKYFERDVASGSWRSLLEEFAL